MRCQSLVLRALVALALVICGCAPGEDSPVDRGSSEQALIAKQAPLPAPDQPAEVLTLEIAGNWLVSPRWSPSGRFLITRGFHGTGLFVWELATGRIVYEDVDHRGSYTFLGDTTVCTNEGSAQEGVVDLATGELARRSCYQEAELHPDYGRILHVGDHEAFYFHPLYANVTRENEDGSAHLIATGVSSAVVSPGEDLVACAQGPIGESELFVARPDGSTDRVGAGAFPVSIDKNRLLFAELHQDPGVEGPGRYRSELSVYDVRTASTTPLTATDDVAEVEPMVAPDGSRVAYADWRSGRVHIMDLEVGR